MKAPMIPSDEAVRLETLQALNVLDTPFEERFDRITHLATKLFDVPIALVSLVDENRQWFKSCQGLNAAETDRDISFCGHAILNPSPLIIEDALADDRFSDNPLVTNDPHIRFYAGQPLSHPNGQRIGTLCLIDRKPRALNDQQQQVLRELGHWVELELLNTNQATTDSETGLSNRQGFVELGQLALDLCNRHGRSATVVFLFVKGLMSLHRRGELAVYNQILAMLTEEFNSAFRSSDILGRYDESSFVALLTNTNIDATGDRISKLTDLLNTQLALVAEGVSIVSGQVSNDAEDDLNSLLFKAFANLHN